MFTPNKCPAAIATDISKIFLNLVCSIQPKRDWLFAPTDIAIYPCHHGHLACDFA